MLSTITILLVMVIFSARAMPSMRLLRLLVEGAELLGIGGDGAKPRNLAALVEVLGIFDRKRLALAAGGIELRAVELPFAVGDADAVDRRGHETVAELFLFRRGFHHRQHLMKEFAVAVL